MFFCHYGFDRGQNVFSVRLLFEFIELLGVRSHRLAELHLQLGSVVIQNALHHVVAKRTLDHLKDAIVLAVENLFSDLFALVLRTLNDHFLHHVARVFVVTELDKLFHDRVDNVVFDVNRAFADQVLHDVVAELALAEIDGLA